MFLICMLLATSALPRSLTWPSSPTWPLRFPAAFLPFSSVVHHLSSDHFQVFRLVLGPRVDCGSACDPLSINSLRKNSLHEARQFLDTSDEKHLLTAFTSSNPNLYELHKTVTLTKKSAPWKDCTYSTKIRRQQHEPIWLPRVAVSRPNHESWSLYEQVCSARKLVPPSATITQIWKSEQHCSFDTDEHDVCTKGSVHPVKKWKEHQQVAGMSPLIVSQAQPVPMGGQRPVRVLAIPT